jgi:hypothetical protein
MFPCFGNEIPCKNKINHLKVSCLHKMLAANSTQQIWSNNLNTSTHGDVKQNWIHGKSRWKVKWSNCIVGNGQTYHPKWYRKKKLFHLTPWRWMGSSLSSRSRVLLLNHSSHSSTFFKNSTIETYVSANLCSSWLLNAT